MKDCWIDPKGKIYEVPQCGHNDFAYEYLLKEYGSIEKVYNHIEKIGKQNHYEVLHCRGWIRVEVRNGGKIELLGGCIDLTKPQRNTVDPPMNTIQMRIAKMMCEESGTLFHEAVNDKRFW